jgi:taurine dioxygenase
MKSENSTQIEKSDKSSGTMQFTPLSPSFGVEVRGLNISEALSDPVKATLKQALFQHQVLLIRQQRLDEEQQVRFAHIFGTCRRMWQIAHYPSHNEFTHYLSNVDREGKPVGHHPDIDSTYWHSDGSWSRHPARATVLNALRVPAGEGNTHFANLYQMYESLDPSSRARLEKLKAEHHVELSRAARYGRLPSQWWQAGPDRKPVATQLKWWAKVLKRRWREGAVYHPVVRSHPETGRAGLFIGDHAWRIAGRFWPTGIRLMKAINNMKFDPAAVYIHEWQKDDLLIWDNGSVLHRVGGYDIENQVRIMRRCVVLE